MSATASSRQAAFKSERISSKSADAAVWMQCAQNLRNPARGCRAGAMHRIFYSAQLGEILFSTSVHVVRNIVKVAYIDQSQGIPI